MAQQSLHFYIIPLAWFGAVLATLFSYSLALCSKDLKLLVLAIFASKLFALSLEYNQKLSVVSE